MSVIIFSDREDLHADCIVSALKERGEDAIRLSPIDDFNKEFFFSSSRQESFVLGGEEVKLSEVTGVYCRVAIERLSECFMPRNPLERYCIEEESSAWLTALLQIPGRCWINDPRHEIWSDVKPHSLLIASQIGLLVPNFIISNSISRSEKFSASGQKVIKPISDASLARQRGEYVDVPGFSSFDSVGTSFFRSDKFNPQEVNDTPFLLQEYIQRREEYRVTVVDDRVIAGRTIIESELLDIKDSTGQDYILCQIPRDQEVLLQRLMRALGLRICTFDMIVAGDGILYLLDINPGGNWLWLDLQFGGLISGKIASGLLRGSVAQIP